MRSSTWARWIAPGLVVVAVLLAAGSPASAQGTDLEVALQGDTSDVDLHMTTHHVSRVALLNVYARVWGVAK